MQESNLFSKSFCFFFHKNLGFYFFCEGGLGGAPSDAPGAFENLLKVNSPFARASFIVVLVECLFELLPDEMDDYENYGRDVDAAVASALRQLRPPVRGPALLWETGYLSRVFGGVPLLGMPSRGMQRVPELPIGNENPRIQDSTIDVVTTMAVLPERDAASTVAKRRRLDDVSIQDFDDHVLDQALRAWRGLLGEMREASGLYRQIVNCTNDQLANRSFHFAFYGKPASTLMRRACSLRLFVRWAHAAGRSPFPLTEDTVFRYLDDLNLEGAPPTRADSFKQALNFAKGYAGLEGVPEAVGSRRVLGAALSSFSRKRELSKRVPLTKAELLRLEAFLLEDAPGTERDRVLVGFILFCTFARLRVGDASRIRIEPTLDVSDEGRGFIEAGMLEHKTSFRVRARVRLPVAGSAIGIGGGKWAAKWLELRRSLNLDASKNHCLMPAPGFDGSWSASRLMTTDCTVWMREVLRTVCDTDQGRVIGLGSHSCKATLLSWSAKYGMAAGLRRRLGGHVKPGDKSLVEYARDEMAGPLRELDKLLEAVRLGIFVPDSTRSGRFVHDELGSATLEYMFPAAATPVVSVGSTVNDSESAFSRSSSSASEMVDTENCSSQEEVVAAVVAEDVAGMPASMSLPSVPAGGLVRNIANGILHGVRDSKRLLCGKPFPKTHLTLESWPRMSYPLCRGCFRPSHLTDK